MVKMVTRQDSAKAVLLNTPNSEQVKKIEQMHLDKYIQITPNKVAISKLSPQQIVDRREFLNEKGQALYSVEQVLSGEKMKWLCRNIPTESEGYCSNPIDPSVYIIADAHRQLEGVVDSKL